MASTKWTLERIQRSLWNEFDIDPANLSEDEVRPTIHNILTVAVEGGSGTVLMDGEGQPWFRDEEEECHPITDKGINYYISESDAGLVGMDKQFPSCSTCCEWDYNYLSCYLGTPGNPIKRKWSDCCDDNLYKPLLTKEKND